MALSDWRIFIVDQLRFLESCQFSAEIRRDRRLFDIVTVGIVDVHHTILMNAVYITVRTLA